MAIRKEGQQLAITVPHKEKTNERAVAEQAVESDPEPAPDEVEQLSSR